MPKTLNTVCSASRSHFRAAPRTAHVWISDDLLSDTYNAFARHHKRHGSSVPGPLEARRRSAKRKLTSLGQSAVANNSFDPTGLFGCQSQAGWWGTTEPAQTKHQQPSWCWPFPAPAPALPPNAPEPALPVEARTSRARNTASRVHRPQTSQERLTQLLKQIRTHEALLHGLTESQIDLVQNPHLTRRILSNMTRTKCEFEEIAAFLLDPRTNPAGSGNHFYLFKYWETHVELLRWLFERNIIFKAVELGLVDVDDLKKIVFWAHETNPTIFSDKTDRTGFCNGLLEAVERSRVLKLQDFGEQFLEKWLRRTRGSEFQTSTPQLLWRICRNSISDDGLLLRNTLSTSISMIDRSSIHLLPSLVDFMLAKPHQLINKSIFMYTWMLRQRLSIIPPSDETGSEVRSNASFRKALLARTSAEFGRIAASTAMSENVAYFKSTPATVADVELDREPSRIELWYAILAGLGTARSNQFTLCQSSFMEWVDHGKTEPDERSRLLVGLWTVMALSARDDSALVRFKDIPLGQVILERFSAECEQRGEDILASIVTNLQRSRLFAKNKFLHRLETFSDGLINVRSSYRTLDIQLASLKERELSKLSDKLFYSSARHHFPHLLRSVAESVNKDLAQFEQLGCNIIRDVQGSINLVLRLLFHNQKLKFALSRAASGMAEDTADSLQMNRAAPTDTALGGYTYAQLVAMIDNFAIECATTTTISDRNAFRKVYWLHMYLQMHCAPITPRMRRALWHAVAMRPQKPTYRLVKYVCDLVADYEGWHAAQQLLCAAARESREKVLGNAVKARRLERSRLAAAGLQVDTMHQVNTMHQGEGHNLLNMDLEEDIASDDDYGESHEADGVKVANGEPNSPVARDVNEIQTRITERSPEYENATVYVPFTENNQEG